MKRLPYIVIVKLVLILGATHVFSQPYIPRHEMDLRELVFTPLGIPPKLRIEPTNKPTKVKIKWNDVISWPENPLESYWARYNRWKKRDTEPYVAPDPNEHRDVESSTPSRRPGRTNSTEHEDEETHTDRFGRNVRSEENIEHDIEMQISRHYFVKMMTEPGFLTDQEKSKMQKEFNTWQETMERTGYDVYRANNNDSGTGPGRFAKITEKLIRSTTFIDEDLEPNTKYWWQIIARYPDGKKGTSEPFAFTTNRIVNPASFIARLEPETDVLLRFNKDVILSWSKVEGADYYRLWGDGLQDTILNVSSNHAYRIVNRQPGTYNYYLVAYCKNKSGKIFGDESNPARISVRVPHSMIGFADLHCHQMANFAFGGKLFFGKAFKEALPEICDFTHIHTDLPELGHIQEPFSVFWEPFLRSTYCSNIFKPHNMKVREPQWDNLTHQVVYEDWLYNAYKGGLRLMVMLAVNNEWLCEKFPKAPGRACSDDEAIRLQIDAAKEMETHIDSKYSEDGKGWYRIAYSAREAKEIIQEGKLAVILGVEVDYPLASYLHILRSKTHQEILQDIERRLEEYYNMGIRHMFLVHFDNNIFGGTAYDNFLKEQAQDLAQNPLRPYKVTTRHDRRYRRDDGRCNILGLTDFGKFLTQKMMKKGMIIDIDHMSAIAKSQVLDIAEQYKYPAIVSGHSGYVEIAEEDEKSHEGNLIPEEINRIRNLSGMIAPILNQGHDIKEWTSSSGTHVPHICKGSSETFVQAYLYAKDKMQGKPVAIGSDFNGMINAFGPRFLDEACPCGHNPESAIRKETNYPFTSLATGVRMDKSIIDNKAYDINYDGLAHVGMLPDMIAELQTLGLTNQDLEPLMNSAKGYVEMWKKAEKLAAKAIITPYQRWSDAPSGQINTPDGDVINYKIERKAFDGNAIEFKLELSEGITWWKSVGIPDEYGVYRDVECQDNVKISSRFHSIPYGLNGKCLIFKKAKGGGRHQSNIEGYKLCDLEGLSPGSKITFTWIKD